MKKILRSIGWFIRSIFTEGNPGAGPDGTDRFREMSNEWRHKLDGLG